ncbi:MAG: TIM barrel protein, partial [Gemmataceae bacterium]|nr:TIM barrel protein [Gemmataceae bacterium]
MYIACSTLSFRKLSLEETLRTIREMRFSKADVAIHADGPHLTPAEVAADTARVAQRLKTSNLAIAAFHVSVHQPDSRDSRQQFHAICRLARMATVPLITMLAAPLGSDFDQEIARLREWLKIAEKEGVILTVETHSATITADPLGAIELCRRVAGLALTLDPSHYQISPHGPLNYDCLLPHVRHVRLRDSGRTPDQFQVRIGQGEIE